MEWERCRKEQPISSPRAFARRIRSNMARQSSPALDPFPKSVYPLTVASPEAGFVMHVFAFIRQNGASSLLAGSHERKAGTRTRM
jgi:hypothetical protein